MKKFFTLFAAAFCAAGMYAADGPQQVTMTWALSSTTALGADVTPESEITTEDMTLGSGLKTNGNRTTNGVKGVNIICQSSYSSSMSSTTDYYIQFPFTVPEGKQFTVTNVSYYLSKNGTGDEFKANVMMYVPGDSPVKKTIENGVAMTRNNEENGYYTYKTYNEEEVGKAYEEANEGKQFNPLTGENYLTFNISSANKSDPKKDFWISSVVISGVLAPEGYVEEKTKAPISWSVESVELKVRDPFTAPTFTNDKNLEVTFSSSNDKVATVNEEGVIEFVATDKGEAVISAVYDGDEYQRTEVTTKIIAQSNVINAYEWDTFPASEAVTPTYLWKADKTSGTLDNGSKLIDDDNITVETVYDATYTSNAKDYLGQTFSGAAQLGRVNAAPSGDNVNGTAYNSHSPIIVTPQTDLQLVVYYRRQGVEQSTNEVDDKDANEITRTHVIGYTANDNKSLFAVAHSALDTQLDQEVLYGVTASENASGNDYIYVASVWNLKAGEKYTLYSTGTGLHVNGVGYILPKEEPVAPAVPTAKVDGAEISTIDIKGKDVVVNFEAEEEGHNVYAVFVPGDLDDETVEEANAATRAEGDADVDADATAPADTMQHDDLEGVDFSLVGEEGVTVNQVGTLYFFSHNPANDLKSELCEIAVTDSTTAIEGIATDVNGEVEYYNLQGVRVANPENGIYIRRQGNTVSKVLVK